MANADLAEVFVETNEEIKTALRERAIEKGLTINDVAVGILASAFNVPHEGKGGRYSGAAREAGDSPSLVLRMPHRLRTKLKQAALANDRPLRAEIVEHLCAGLGIEAELAA